MVPSSHMWLLNMGNVAGMTEEILILFNLIIFKFKELHVPSSYIMGEYIHIKKNSSTNRDEGI